MQDNGEPFTKIAPEKRAAVTLRNGGKLLDAMVIASDGKQTSLLKMVMVN